MTTPEITVVMAVRNGQQYLEAAIRSILNQDFDNFECVIVNDGSTDETGAILSKQSDPRLRIFHRQPAGLPASLNFGIQQSRSPLIARHDADDISTPHRLRILASRLAASPEAVLCHSDCEFEVENQTTVPRQYVPRSRALTALTLCYRTPVVHGSVLFRRSCFDAVGGYNETFAQAQDYDLWTRMIERGPFVFCREKLYTLRFHFRSVTTQKAQAQAQFRRQIGQEACRRLFGVDAVDAERIFKVLDRNPESRTPREWLQFIRRDLPRLKYQSAELYFWAAVQVARSFRRATGAGQGS